MTIFTDVSTEGWGNSYGGFPIFRHLVSYRPQAPYQLFGVQDGNVSFAQLGSSAPGPPGNDCYREHYTIVWIYGSGYNPQHSAIPSSYLQFQATSTGGGCTITVLAGTVDVHVSSASLAEQGHFRLERSYL